MPGIYECDSNRITRLYLLREYSLSAICTGFHPRGRQLVPRYSTTLGRDDIHKSTLCTIALIPVDTQLASRPGRVPDVELMRVGHFRTLTSLMLIAPVDKDSFAADDDGRPARPVSFDPPLYQEKTCHPDR